MSLFEESWKADVGAHFLPFVIDRPSFNYLQTTLVRKFSDPRVAGNFLPAEHSGISN